MNASPNFRKDKFMNKFEALQPMFERDLSDVRKEIPENVWRESRGEIGINAVFGISHTVLPARFLAGFVPVMALGEALDAQKKPIKPRPELRIFVPIHLAQACGISEKDSRESLNEGVLFIQKFQEIFHPSLQWFLDIDNPMNKQHIEILTKMSDEILQVFHDELSQDWQKIEKAAERRGIPETAQMYASHGVFGWQDFHDVGEPQFFRSQSKLITLNCMSTAEEPFRKFHETMKIHFPWRKIHGGKHIDLFTKFCRRPHYLRVDIGSHQEPTLSELILAGFEKTRSELESMKSLSHKFKQAERDLELINTHIENERKVNPGLPNFDEFLQEIRQVK